ncbi:MAG: amidase [Burkholderiales bacterium]|nr:amidase [Burkholderiales bacterium]
MSSVARLEAVLADIAARNGALAIYLQVDADGARAAAAAADRRLATGAARSPLDGCLVGVKDNIDVAGLATTAGLGFRRGRVAARDAFVVERLRAAGAVIVGKLNMHPAAFGATNRNADFGDCANPTHPGLVPGGSSGGSAAAVAAGWADLALGSDTLGSVRLPASYCGVAGFKPTGGAISNGGVVPLSTRLDQVGLLAPDVAGLERGLAATAAFDPDCAGARAIDAAPVAAPTVLRAPRTPLGAAVEPGVWARFEAALAALERGGFRVERFDAPPVDLGRLRRAALLLSTSELLVTFEAEWRDARPAFPPDMAAAMAWAEGKSARDLARALHLIDGGGPLLRRLLGAARCLLLPAAPQVAFAIDARAPDNQADLTTTASLAGAPAASVPMPRADGALSAGLQIVGHPGADREVLAVARAYEALAAAR